MFSIFKQSAWFFGAQALARVLGFFYIIFLARNLGVSDFGLYSVALTAYLLTSTFAEFGFNRFLAREIAIDKTRASFLLTNVAFLRFLLSFALFVVLSMILNLSDPSKSRAYLISLGLLATVPTALAQTIDALFVASQKLQLSALGAIFSSFATVALGVWLILNGKGTFGAATAIILGQVAYLLILFLLAQGRVNFSERLDFSIFRKIIKGAMPYGLLGILGLLFFRVDTLLLSYIRGDFETGIYSAAYKFLEALVVIPSAVSLAIFPIMARMHRTGVKGLKALYLKAFGSVALIGVCAGVAFYFILPKVIEFLLPNYLGSIAVIKILALTLPFMFAHTVAAQLLLTSEKYLNPLMFISVFPLLFNISLNLIFIPTHGVLAAAWVTVASDIFSLSLLLGFIHKFVFKDV